jgi:4-alpha-glucanotransferase
MPGADKRPNWCLPLAVPVEELAEQPGVQAVARVLADGLEPPVTKRSARSSRKK